MIQNIALIHLKMFTHQLQIQLSYTVLLSVFMNASEEKLV